MKLRTYIKDQGLTIEEFANQIGVPKGTIGRYCKGTRFPNRKMFLRIQKATAGKVTPNDFFELNETVVSEAAQ